MSNKIVKLYLIFLLVFGSFVVGNAQPNSWRKTGTDGSYPLGSSDYINLFNGKLNFTLPLLNSKGRGKSGMSLPLSIGSDVWMKYTHFEPIYTSATSGSTYRICNVHYSYVTASYGQQTSTQGTPIEECYDVPFSGGNQVVPIYLGQSQFRFVFVDPRGALNPGYGPGVLYGLYQKQSYTFIANPLQPTLNLENAGTGRMTIRAKLSRKSFMFNTDFSANFDRREQLKTLSSLFSRMPVAAFIC